MAQPIAARKPFLVVDSNTSIVWDITSQLEGDPSSLLTYQIVKTSYTEGVAEDLSINISPFAKDRFDPKTSTFPVTIEDLVNPQRVEVSITPTFSGITQEFIATDGWEKITSSVLVPISTLKEIRNLTKNSKQYLTANLAAIQTIQYVLNTGQLVEVTNPNFGSSTLQVFPTIHPNLVLGDNEKILTIIARDSSNAIVWSTVYELVCPYEDSHTIGFINRFGIWEFIDVVGRADKGVQSTREQFRRFDTGALQDYGVNGSVSYQFNTGLVGSEFESILQELVLSETIVLYDGITEDTIALSLETTDFTYLNDRADKIINYSLGFTSAETIIPTIAGAGDTVSSIQSF